MEYTIIWSERKTLAIHVTADALVEVRAPKKLSRGEIEKFVIAKRDWIDKTRQKILARAENISPLTSAKEAELINKAKEIIPLRVEYYSKIMGVAPARVKINGAKTRWGSCSGKNSLNFSWRLMMMSDDAVDYVVVHELAHIKEHNHSKRFWAVVQSVLPDYKKLKS